VPDETHNADGCHICYLQKNPANDRRFRACDEKVYDALAKMVFQDNDRSITALERADLLPGAAYCREDVCYGRRRISCPRDGWFKIALEKTAGCELVFVDPDNGIECNHLLPTQAKSRKYVFRCEIRKLIERGQSVVVYHQTGFNLPTPEQVRRHLRILAETSALPNRPFGVLFRRGAIRAFLIIPAQQQYQVLLGRTEALLRKWGDHFSGPIFA